MKNLKYILILAAVAWLGFNEFQGGGFIGGPASGDNSAIIAAYEDRRSGVLVQGQGMVSRVLADDNEGSRHQRFVLSIDNQHTVLVAHNIDLAPRVSGLKVGDSVEFQGQYEWNDRGGVIHWTHHDPQGNHPGGWLKVAGQTYQ